MREKKDIRNLVIIGIVCVSVLIISLIAYVLNTTNAEKEIGSEEESASTQIGKTVEESENEISENETDFETANVVKNITTSTNTSTATSTTISNTTAENTTIENKEEDKNETNETNETNSSTENDTEVTFCAPIKGEILREFATDSLVYSETLKEWITHNGIDIKADKTSVVTAAADGTVYAIKNDPRYGLTVIINHDNGYQTIYSNLLTSEFVVKGEEVKQGQSIGTVGNTASFEVGDDYHLHFELLKDNEYLDPTIYIDID